MKTCDVCNGEGSTDNNEDLAERGPVLLGKPARTERPRRHHGPRETNQVLRLQRHRGVPVKTMAEVLAEHHILYAYVPAMAENQWTCTGRECEFRSVNFSDAITHQEAMLTGCGVWVDGRREKGSAGRSGGPVRYTIRARYSRPCRIWRTAGSMGRMTSPDTAPTLRRLTRHQPTSATGLRP